MKRFSKGFVKVFMITLILFIFVSGNVIAGERITVVDYDGVESTLELPVKRIVCLSTALNQVLYALGVGDRIIGRDKKSDFAEDLKNIPIVGSSSYRPQVEAILELKPDIVIADTMLKDEHRKQFALFEIPVVVERASEKERLFTLIRNLAKIVEKETRGEELISFITTYEDLIAERLADLKDSEKTRVYWEWSKPYKTGSAGASVQSRIEFTGGVNICAELEGKYPITSGEYVWQKDPQLIVKMCNRGDTVDEMKILQDKILNRTGLQETAAVKEDNVHIISWDIHNGIASVIGSLYYAKWSHPKRFADIDPAVIYDQLLKDFLGIKEYHQVVYPD